MNRNQILAILALLLAAATTGWLAWLLREPPPLAEMTGPPRSDYLLTDFSLIALDEFGKESFAARGPRLARHPFAGTLEVTAPEFSLPDPKGGQWEVRSQSAWVSADGSELRLLRDVSVQAPPESQGATHIATERLDLFPRLRTLSSPLAVTVSGPGFILRGVGLEAELDSRRFQLLDQVTARYEPPTR